MTRACAPFFFQADEKSLTGADGLDFGFKGDGCRQAGCSISTVGRIRTGDGTKSTFGRDAKYD